MFRYYLFSTKVWEVTNNLPFIFCIILKEVSREGSNKLLTSLNGYLKSKDTPSSLFEQPERTTLSYLFVQLAHEWLVLPCGTGGAVVPRCCLLTSRRVALRCCWCHYLQGRRRTRLMITVIVWSLISAISAWGQAFIRRPLPRARARALLA